MHDGGNLSLSCSCPCPKLDGRRPKRESGEDRKGNAYSTRYRPVMHKQGWTENPLLFCSKHVWSAQFSVNFCFSLQTHTHKSWVLEGKNSLLWGMPGKVQHDFFFFFTGGDHHGIWFFITSLLGLQYRGDVRRRRWKMSSLTRKKWV